MVTKHFLLGNTAALYILKAVYKVLGFKVRFTSLPGTCPQMSKHCPSPQRILGIHVVTGFQWLLNLCLLNLCTQHTNYYNTMEIQCELEKNSPHPFPRCLSLVRKEIVRKDHLGKGGVNEHGGGVVIA